VREILVFMPAPYVLHRLNLEPVPRPDISTEITLSLKISANFRAVTDHGSGLIETRIICWLRVQVVHPTHAPGSLPAVIQLKYLITNPCRAIELYPQPASRHPQKSILKKLIAKATHHAESRK